MTVALVAASLVVTLTVLRPAPGTAEAVDDELVPVAA